MFASVNHDILIFLYTLATSSDFFRAVFIFLAEWFPYLVVASVVIYESATQVKEHEIMRVIIRTAFPSFVVWVVVFFIKLFFPSPRPFAGDLGITPLVSVTDPFGSFPSAHAAVFSALAGTMLANHFHAWKWYLLAAILIALARVATGVHFPIDVLVGTVLGLFLGFFLSKILMRGAMK